MRKRTVCFGLLLGCCTLAAGATVMKVRADMVKSPNPFSNPNLTPDHYAALFRRRAQIKAECAGKNVPDWAGDYYYGDGMAVNVSVSLAPKSGFAYQSGGCGLDDINFGAVRAGAGDSRNLDLNNVLPERLAGATAFDGGLPATLIPVRWGQRHYLILPDQMFKFCDEVNTCNCLEQEGLLSPICLLRRGDDKRPTYGVPEIPPAYRSYLLPRPVTARIVSLSSIGPSDQWDDTGYRNRARELEHDVRGFFQSSIYDGRDYESANAVLDAGRNKGLLPGMTMRTNSDDVTAKILQSDATTSTVEIDKTDADLAFPDVGAQFETGMR